MKFFLDLLLNLIIFKTKEPENGPESERPVKREVCNQRSRTLLFKSTEIHYAGKEAI